MYVYAYWSECMYKIRISIPICFPKLKYHFATVPPNCPQCTILKYGAWLQSHTSYKWQGVYICINIIYGLKMNVYACKT